MNTKMYYISAASTISHQPTFQNEGFSNIIKELENGSALISPEYKHFIDPGLLRRMSKILRMSVACSKECISQAQIVQPNAIVVGTGLGCLQDTEKFLNTSLTVEGLLPPTSFIQSTHNTMAGQVSLSLANHGYNMTHTQNTLSFEHALLDTMLLLEDGEEAILVGAADEYIDILTEITQELNFQPAGQFTSAASFFVLSSQPGSNDFACVKDCRPIAFSQNVIEETANFLTSNALKMTELDLVLFGTPQPERSENLVNMLVQQGVEEEKLVNYLAFSGIYPTASAFGMHYAADLMKGDSSVKNVLVLNALRAENLGLTLIQTVEA
jgi:hypothetical protein